MLISARIASRLALSLATSSASATGLRFTMQMSIWTWAPPNPFSKRRKDARSAVWSCILYIFMIRRLQSLTRTVATPRAVSSGRADHLDGTMFRTGRKHLTSSHLGCEMSMKKITRKFPYQDAILYHVGRI